MTSTHLFQVFTTLMNDFYELKKHRYVDWAALAIAYGIASTETEIPLVDGHILSYACKKRSLIWLQSRRKLINSYFKSPKQFGRAIDEKSYIRLSKTDALINSIFAKNTEIISKYMAQVEYARIDENISESKIPNVIASLKYGGRRMVY